MDFQSIDPGSNPGMGILEISLRTKSLKYKWNE